MGSGQWGKSLAASGQRVCTWSVCSSPTNTFWRALLMVQHLPPTTPRPPAQNRLCRGSLHVWSQKSSESGLVLIVGLLSYDGFHTSKSAINFAQYSSTFLICCDVSAATKSKDRPPFTTLSVFETWSSALTFLTSVHIGNDGKFKGDIWAVVAPKGQGYSPVVPCFHGLGRDPSMADSTLALANAAPDARHKSNAQVKLPSWRNHISSEKPLWYDSQSVWIWITV